MPSHSPDTSAQTDTQSRAGHESAVTQSRAETGAKIESHGIASLARTRTDQTSHSSSDGCRRSLGMNFTKHSCAEKPPAKHLCSTDSQGSSLLPKSGSLRASCFGEPFGISFQADHALLAALSHAHPLPHLHMARPTACEHVLLIEMQVSPHGLPLQHSLPLLAMTTHTSSRKTSRRITRSGRAAYRRE